MLRGDQVLAVGDVDVSSASLDAVMEIIGKAASSVRIQMGRNVRVPAGQGNTLLVGSTFAPCFAALVSLVCVSMSCCLSIESLHKHKQAVPMGGPGAGDDRHSCLDQASTSLDILLHPFHPTYLPPSLPRLHLSPANACSHSLAPSRTPLLLHSQASPGSILFE